MSQNLKKNESNDYDYQKHTINTDNRRDELDFSEQNIDCDKYQEDEDFEVDDKANPKDEQQEMPVVKHSDKPKPKPSIPRVEDSAHLNI